MDPFEINARCRKELGKLKLSDYIAVVGSGPSSAYIAPIKKLKERLLKECGATSLSEPEFWDLAEEAHSSNPDQYHTILRELYEEPEHWNARAYEHLAEISFRNYITFNYDNKLAIACDDYCKRNGEELGFTCYPVHPKSKNTYYSPLQLKASETRLIAIHGFADEKYSDWTDHIILRRSEYLEHYINPGAQLFTWWRDMLLAAPCIFIGTSLREPGLWRVSQHLLKTDREAFLGMNHIHLLPDPEPKFEQDTLTLDFARKIPFHCIDNRFSGLCRVLAPFSGLSDGPPVPRLEAPEEFGPTNPPQFPD